LKTTHAELGACLLGIWGIPNNIVEAVAYHHNPSILLENTSIKDPMDLAVLTSVHVANSLLMQGDCSSDTTVFPNVDMKYLKTFNLIDKLPEWAECCKNISSQKE
jgi:HD-like signal output (HDOD) protein